MPLSLDALTPAQRKAVRWLRKYSGRVHTPPIPTGETRVMHGQNASGKLRSSLVWRSTFSALASRGWLVMDGAEHWKLTDAAREAVFRAWADSDGFTKEVA